MNRLAIKAQVGKADNGLKIPASQYEEIITLSFEKFEDKRDVSIHRFLQALRKLKLEPTESAMDLLIVACCMYAADTRFPRKKYGEDGWTRVIDLYIPVQDPVLWDKNKDNLRRIFRFLTGDIWNVVFRRRKDKNLLLSPKSNFKKYGMPYETKSVCLFSGGMDSFIGTVNLLEKGIKPLLVSQSKSPEVAHYQELAEAALHKQYKQAAPERIKAHIGIPKENKSQKENSERGRSFLFFTLGGIVASCLGKKSTLIVPENGVISLNIPLTPLRTGTHSTRTTHPHYMQMMRQLFSELELNVKIENPFQFKTKGAMLTECLNKVLVAKAKTLSCSHPVGRWLGKGTRHCGYCVPCLIRQASFLKARVKDPMSYRVNILTKKIRIKNAEGLDIMAFKYMIERVKIKPAFLLASIRNTGSLGEKVDNFVKVYAEGLEEVNNLIKLVKLE